MVTIFYPFYSCTKGKKKFKGSLSNLNIFNLMTDPEERWVEEIKYAIDIGYRLIDCSPIYRNEKMIGGAIAEKIAEGAIKREEIFITSKLWNNKHEKDAVLPALKKSLANLGLQYIDLYLINWPFAVPDIAGEFFPKDKDNNILTSDIDYKTTWKGMEECVDKGFAKSIGLCNFNIRQIRDVWKNSKIKPVVLQIECHPYLSGVDIINYCKSLNITVTACLPIGKRIPPMKGRSLLDDPVLKTIARKHKKKASQVAIRYQMDRGLAVITESANMRRILEDNFNVFDFSVSKKDVLVLDCLNKDERYMELKEYIHHKHYPFKNEPDVNIRETTIL